MSYEVSGQPVLYETAILLVQPKAMYNELKTGKVAGSTTTVQTPD
jgi:hypothetical protein